MFTAFLQSRFLCALLFFLGACVFLGCDDAAEGTWSKTFSLETNQWFQEIIPTRDGNLLLADHNGPSGCNLVKMDPGGAILWEKYFDMPDSVLAYQEMASGEIIMGQGTSLMKISADGLVLWENEYANYPETYITHLAADSTGTSAFAAGGQYNSATGNNTISISRIESDGTSGWGKTLQTGQNYIRGIAASSDGGAFMVYDDFDSNLDTTFCITRLDATGSVIWSRNFTTDRSSSIDSTAYISDYVRSIDGTADGGCIISGSLDMGDPYTAGIIWMVKFDAKGMVKWARDVQNVFVQLPKSDSLIENSSGVDGMSVMQTSDGGYSLMVSAASYIATDYRIYFYQQMLSKVWLIKLDADGNIIWQKTYRDRYKTIGPKYVEAGDYPGNMFLVWKSNTILFSGLNQFSDGGFLLAGNVASSYGNDGHALVLKTDDKGGITGSGLVIQKGNASVSAITVTGADIALDLQDVSSVITPVETSTGDLAYMVKNY